MAQLAEHTVTKAAGLLADRLIEVYQAEQVGVLVNEFARAGFTKESLFYLQRNRPRQLDALVRSLGTL